MAPGSSRMETPAMPFEIGSCLTVASFPELWPMTFPSDFSRANLNVGSSSPERAGSGTLFMKLGSPASAGFAAVKAAVAKPAVPTRTSRRRTSDMALPRFVLQSEALMDGRETRARDAETLQQRSAGLYHAGSYSPKLSVKGGIAIGPPRQAQQCNVRIRPGPLQS